MKVAEVRAAAKVRETFGFRPSAALLASFLQAIRLTGAVTQVPRREFVHCSGWDGTPFAELRARLDADPDWQVHDIPAGHDAMREAPEAVAALLLDE